MVEKEIQFQKKREVGEIITDSFRFLQQEYKPVLKLVTIYVLPFIFLLAYVQIQVQQKLLSGFDFTDLEKLKENIGPFYKNIFISGIFSLFVQSLLAATFYSYLEAYIKKGKGNFTLSDVTPFLFANGLIALKANLVFFVIVVVGLFLCFVPGIYFANILSIVVIVSMFERKGTSNAFMKTVFLVNSQWWNTLLLNLLAIIIIWSAGFVVTIPAMFTGISVDLFGTEPVKAEQFPAWYWVLSGLSSVISSILWIIIYTFWAFQYFNLNERMKAKFPPSV